MDIRGTCALNEEEVGSDETRHGALTERMEIVGCDLRLLFGSLGLRALEDRITDGVRAMNMLGYLPTAYFPRAPGGEPQFPYGLFQVTSGNAPYRVGVAHASGFLRKAIMNGLEEGKKKQLQRWLS
jgi:hypothetical protein